MSSIVSKKELATTNDWMWIWWDRIRIWLGTWEFYPILIIASFLRLYNLNSAEFDGDQADIYRMARDAIAHGLLPATSNIASIRILNPPAVVYFLMLPAALSADPLWGTVFVGLLNVAAVILTYYFVRRYFGRLAGSIAALSYATAVKPLLYSRFLWQQNMIAPLIVLFLCTLFWGVVERRKGWLFPALALLGILYQLHETTTLLVAPLAVAVLLAPGTIRWRDIILGAVALCLLFITYLLWQISNAFGDVYTLLRVAKIPSHIDNQAFLYYRFFLSPYGLNTYEKPPTNAHLLIFRLIPVLKWVRRIMLICVAGGFGLLAAGLIWPQLLPWSKQRQVTKEEENRDAEQSSSVKSHHWWSRVYDWPYRGGLFVLLAWQLVPLLVLSRHAVPVYPYYLLTVMPGPYILIGLFLAGGAKLFQTWSWPRQIAQYSVCILAIFLVLSQLVGTTAAIIDSSNGNVSHGASYNDLASLEHAVSAADQLAQQHRLNHVYLATDDYTQSTLSYLARQMSTPVTLFDASRSLLLPSVQEGPAVLLVGPDDQLTTALLHQFASATLMAQPKRLGGRPFDLYIVHPSTSRRQMVSPSEFLSNLQLLDQQTHHIRLDQTTWVVTDWAILRTDPSAFNTTYSYILNAIPNGSVHEGRQAYLNFSNLRQGDQLLVAFDLPTIELSPHGKLAPTVDIEGTSFTKFFNILKYGPLRLETFATSRTPAIRLQTENGKESIIVSRT